MERVHSVSTYANLLQPKEHGKRSEVRVERGWVDGYNNKMKLLSTDNIKVVHKNNTSGNNLQSNT